MATSANYQGIKRENTIIEKLVSSKLFWFLFCSFFFTYPLVRSLYRELPAELPRYGQLTPFNLTDENGQNYGSYDLKGQVYMANFHFTSCPTICADLMRKLQVVQKRIKGLDKSLVKIVSFTVDPKTDTPKKLFKYARDLKASPYVWKFLTGENTVLEKLLVDGFKVPMGKKEGEADMYDIAHTGKIVLVDHNGDIRGYYSTDDTSINKLMIDLGLLVNREQIKYSKKGS